MEDEILRRALAPGDECLSPEQLGRYADGALDRAERAAAESHVRQCLTCQAELALLESVTSGGPRSEEEDVVRRGVARLEERRAQIVGADRHFELRRSRFHVPFAAVAAVALVVIAASGYYLLTPAIPALPGNVTTGNDTRRSLTVEVRSPLGDLVESPQRFEWSAVDRAVRYRVRLLEVDRHEVWSATTTALEAELPADIRTSIVPMKTVLWDVTAYDAAGAVISESGPQSFRIVPR